MNPGYLGWSTAGHDSGTLYVIIEENETRFTLADGKKKTLSAPKKKNRCHVQLITHLPKPVRERLKQIQTDADIANVIDEYKKGANPCQSLM